MELVNNTRYWIDDIDHCVSFDSWDQFITYGIGLRGNWSELALLSWGCRKERAVFDFQVVYINLTTGKNAPTAKLPVFQKHRFEMKCVTARITEADVPLIKTWLVENNPDLWRMKNLVEIAKKEESPSVM